jgi:hypothetical protein
MEALTPAQAWNKLPEHTSPEQNENESCEELARTSSCNGTRTTNTQTWMRELKAELGLLTKNEPANSDPDTRSMH